MKTTHGKSETRGYSVWKSMNSRCNLKTDTSYERYGGRGIKVCERWNKFENFYEDMKDVYRAGLTLDRIDNNGNYTKANCRWVTRKEQSNNRRTNIVVKHNGKWYRPMELHKITNIPLGTIYGFEKKKVNK